MVTSTEDELAEAVAATRATKAFGVPGGGANLAMVGALGRHGVEFVLAHSETAACIMAATYGYLTDTCTMAVVTRGPGAASAVNGAAQATLDRHPLLLVSDTVTEATQARIAHQQIDQRALMAPVTKASLPLTPDSAEGAVSLARQWPWGCVHLDQDAGAAPVTVALLEHQANDSLDEVRALITTAERPVVIVGAAALADAEQLRPVIERFGAPTFTTYQAIGIIDSESPINAGLFTNGASEGPLLDQADLIVLVGLDMVEPIPQPWTYSAPVVSLSPISTAVPYAPIQAEAVGNLASSLGDALQGDHHWTPGAGAEHREAVRGQLRAHGIASFGPAELVDTTARWAASHDNLTVTVDAGAHFLAVMPLWPVDQPRRLLISNGLATMGYAVPAAIGAAMARPTKPVLAFVGDGGLGMVQAELETIARLDLPITVVVFNDAALSLIRIKQGPDHGGDAAVAYRMIDFAAVAQAHGIAGVIASTSAELEAALAAAEDAPMLVDARIDPAAYRHLIDVTRG